MDCVSMDQLQDVEIELQDDLVQERPSEELDSESSPSTELTVNIISRATTTSELDTSIQGWQDGGSRPRSGTGSTVAGNFESSTSRIDQMSDIEESEKETSLMLVKHQKIYLKNFSTEVRALKDIERFLEKPTILLNVHKTKLEDIVDVMLNKIIEDKELHDGINFPMARSAFFTKDSVHCLSHVIQGTEISEGGGWEETQNWLVTMADLPAIQQSHIAIARLRHATNLGRTLQGTHLVVLVVSPIKTKKTKNSLEMGRTFATMLSDIDFRQMLLEAETEEEFMKILATRKNSLTNDHAPHKTGSCVRTASNAISSFVLRDQQKEKSESLSPGRGILEDFKRRRPHYLSDFTDGIIGHRTLFKLASTVMFLYFACLLPSIAFGVLNSKNTKGKIDVQKVMISQIIGGIVFSLIGGQPLIVLLSTAPLALYIKVIYTICEDFGLDFTAMYMCTGLWNSFFLVVYSVFGVSNLMRWSTRSTEEIFALFISVAFTVDAASSIRKELSTPYCVGIPYSSCNICDGISNITNVTDSQCTAFTSQTCFCSREPGTVYLLLSVGTVLLGVILYNFKKSPFLDANKREALADYALPVAVLALSFVGSYFFSGQSLRKFESSGTISLSLSSVSSLSAGAVFGACGFGFCLSLLFFMDQNISSAMVNNPGNRLKKGSAFHLDLLVVAIINAFLSIFGLPWVHAALPHSPLHVRALADVEERVDQGHVFDIIVKVRETRLSTLISHVLIGLSLFMLPTPLDYIPTAVLDGLFLFVAVTSLNDNQMFERLLLFLTEQSAYPPNHYIRRVPQRKMHIYTAMQVLQLAILCAFGFGPLPYLKMVFPILLMFLLPIRHIVVPKMIERKFLDALDAYL